MYRIFVILIFILLAAASSRAAVADSMVLTHFTLRFILSIKRKLTKHTTMQASFKTAPLIHKSILKPLYYIIRRVRNTK